MTDEMAWICQALNGEEEGFTRLVEAYQKPVYNLCYRMLGGAEDAEDAAQETFLKAYLNLQRYDRGRPFGTWLLSIAAHHCIDKLRRRKFPTFSIDEDEEKQMELPDSSAPDPEKEALGKQEREALHALLGHLEATDRAAVVLRYWHEASEVEIAETLRLTVPAVKSRLHRARRTLAGKWKEANRTMNVERKAHESPAF